MLYPENIYGEDFGSSFTENSPRIPFKSESYKNWKEINHRRQPDFVSSLGRLLQDKTSEVGSIGSLNVNDHGTSDNRGYPILAEGLPDSPSFLDGGVLKNCCSNCKHSTSQRDPAIADLYRILWLQNEQLSLLHKQVADLVSLKDCNKSKPAKADISTSTDSIFAEKPRKTADASVNTPPLSCLKCESNPRKSKKVLKRNKKYQDDPLLSLKDLDVPRIEYSSSNASVHIDMNDYDITSSSEIDESDTSSSEESPNVGWTFYNGVLDQVNDLLDLAQQPSNQSNYQEVNESYQLPQSYISRRVKFGSSGRKILERTVRNESDVSMKINSLASKYIHCGLNGQVKDISMCNVVTGNTNMSMATIRYMEKHHLIQSPGPEHHPDTYRRKTKISNKRSPNHMSNKILDVTAIRQQPKLLPKFE